MSVITVCGDTRSCLPSLIKTAEAAEKALCLKGSAEVELVFCSKEEIKKINADTRGVNSATDVLSFPALNLSYRSPSPEFIKENFPYEYNEASKAVELGSILICEQVAKKQGEEYGHGYEREINYLFLHGLLHLLGYDHIQEDDRAAMREAEERVLATVGLSRS